MISVKLTYDKEIVSPICEKEGVHYNENSAAVIAKDGECTLGYCVFKIREKDILFEKIVPQNDISLADGLIRSAIFSMIPKGITEAFYSKEAEDVIKRTGFIKDPKTGQICTEKLFMTCKECKKPSL